MEQGEPRASCFKLVTRAPVPGTTVRPGPDIWAHSPSPAWGQGQGQGRGQEEVWLILGRCFLGSQGSRAEPQTGRQDPAWHAPGRARHHGRSRQRPGLLRGGGQAQGPDVQGEGGGWAAQGHQSLRACGSQLPYHAPPSSLSPHPPHCRRGCPLATPAILLWACRGKPHAKPAAEEETGAQQADTGTRHVQADEEGYPTGRGRLPAGEDRGRRTSSR